MRRKTAPSKKRPRSAGPDPSTELRLRTEPVEVTGPLRQRSAQASTELTAETEMPLDAEDVALASLEAKVRAEEAMADVGPARPLVGLTVRLPRAVIAQLLAEAAERNITPSKLVELALAQYLPFKGARRRTR
jgi:hypothetical protein